MAIVHTAGSKEGCCGRRPLQRGSGGSEAQPCSSRGRGGTHAASRHASTEFRDALILNSGASHLLGLAFLRRAVRHNMDSSAFLDMPKLITTRGLR